MKKTSEMSTEDKLKEMGITIEEVREFIKSLRNGVWEQMAGYSFQDAMKNTQKKKK